MQVRRFIDLLLHYWSASYRVDGASGTSVVAGNLA
jgi:hypothetical protein